MRHAKPGVRKTKRPFYRLVGAVFNCAYSVRLKTLVTIYRTAPTGWRKCLFIFGIHQFSVDLRRFVDLVRIQFIPKRFPKFPHFGVNDHLAIRLIGVQSEIILVIRLCGIKNVHLLNFRDDRILP